MTDETSEAHRIINWSLQELKSRTNPSLFTRAPQLQTDEVQSDELLRLDASD